MGGFWSWLPAQAFDCWLGVLGVACRVEGFGFRALGFRV